MKFNVEKLECNSVVYNVTENKLILKYSFRVRLFNEWKKTHSLETIKELLNEKGILEDYIYPKYYTDLIYRFKESGFPIPNCVAEYQELKTDIINNPLVSSGAYHRNSGDGKLIIDDEFWLEIYDNYPDISIKETFINAGLSLEDIGAMRLRKIETYIKYYKEHPEECQRLKKRNITSISTNNDNKVSLSENVNDIMDNPYVYRDSDNNICFKEAFFNDAYLIIGNGIEHVLHIFSINSNWLSLNQKIEISKKLQNWEKTDSELLDCYSDIYMSIQRKILLSMQTLVETNFETLKERISMMNTYQKKKVVKAISNLPSDPLKYYTRKCIISKIGIPYSTFYELLYNDDYGISIIKKDKQDLEDVKLIYQTLNYKGYEKGIRQIHMLMPKVTGIQFSIYRIRRLMNKYNIKTTIRRPSRNRKAMKELIERNKKANILMRKFKLHRPNEVRLTDVTYLDYGDNKRAYGSASIDPVTGKIICFIVSENNDLKLALDTLKAMDNSPAKNGAILHSDQGILYMTDDFQSAVLERELRQSMSRRGNCWDNAVQESFFGHFKDECHYNECKTLEELQKSIDNYCDYYNNERCVWEKKKMSPIEYEKYLQDMDDETFALYLIEEEKKYNERKKISTQKAIQEAYDYKQFTKKQLEV